MTPVIARPHKAISVFNKEHVGPFPPFSPSDAHSAFDATPVIARSHKAITGAPVYVEGRIALNGVFFFYHILHTSNMWLILGTGREYEARGLSHRNSAIPQDIWRSHSCESLDLDPELRPTYTGDIMSRDTWSHVPSARFDAVVDCVGHLSPVYRSANYWPDFVSEIRRVLKPGGIFYGYRHI